MVCTGKDAMTVAGETTFGTNSYDGKMAMSGKMDGQQVEMDPDLFGETRRRLHGTGQVRGVSAHGGVSTCACV